MKKKQSFAKTKPLKIKEENLKSVYDFKTLQSFNFVFKRIMNVFEVSDFKNGMKLQACEKF